MSDAAAVIAALRAAGQLVSAPDPAPPLTGVTADSRRVTPGALFCAVEGSAADGHRYLADAVARGAAAVMVTHPARTGLPELVVRDSRAATAAVAAAWYGRPADRLRLIGVTGTNGKSTTVGLIRHLLNAEADVAVLGTLGAVDGGGASLPGGTGLTTPGPLELHAVFAELVRRGARTLVMETSSHALHQGRLRGLGFAAGVYTNLTHEHLDYHGDLAQYCQAKALLSDLLVDGAVEAVNLDDPAWRALEGRPTLRRVTFGLTAGADVLADQVVLEPDGSTFRLTLGGAALPARIPLIGEFNVSNALAAAAAAWGLGLAPARVVERLTTAPQVPGRMERLAGGAWTVLRDYAHTPDAMRRVLRTLRPVTPGRLLVLFGCGGDRDRAKRPVMGEITAHEADVVILTSDNPRTEDPERILDQIASGMHGVAHLRIPDRRDAIFRAVTMLRPGDCLLLAGKGHETYQLVGAEKQPFDEPAIVRDAVAAAGTGTP